MPGSPRVYVPLVAAVIVAFWIHAVQAPFWQDDFHFLRIARDAREAGEPWLSVFWPADKSIFWRPLSEGLYWRLVEDTLNASPAAAHAVNLAFLAGAALAVAWLVASYAPMVDSRVDPAKAFVVSGILYGLHAAHWIPAVWATAVHTSMVVLFSALALRFWVIALREAPRVLNPGLAAIPLLLLLALFSKENGILVLPLGALMTALIWRRHRPTPVVWAVCAFSVLLALVWLRVRQELVVPPSGAYEMGLGGNSLRNLASMGLFFFNVPRESMRFMLEQQSATSAVWALACLALQATAVWVVMSSISAGARLKAAAAAIAFFILAGAPHLLFSWNSYAYYITLGLIAWPALAALADLSAGRLGFVFGVALLSAGLSVAGNYALDYPALLARAEWANRQLAHIRQQFPPVAAAARANGVEVIAENRHQFLGMDLAGLAWALDLPIEKLRLVDPDTPCAGTAVRLVVPGRGDAWFEEGGG